VAGNAFFVMANPPIGGFYRLSPLPPAQPGSQHRHDRYANHEKGCLFHYYAPEAALPPIKIRPEISWP
jgi:hypothetical protein